ncbi:MAG: S9 family peptidase [Planctomycetota bacterium]|jgi:dipeptidyl aminopeptidase/acylaminoacyl peptidase
MSLSLSLLMSGVLCVHAASDGSSHPFSVHDMLAMERISDPRVSPDGSRVVFTLRTTDLEENRGRTDLWLVRADGSGPRRLTSHAANDHNPRWMPNGKAILFLSGRSGSSQVWRISLDGGEAEQLTDLALDAGNLILSPDGRHMAFTMEVFPDCRSAEDTKKRLDQEATRKSTGRIYDRVFVRHWDTWKDGRRSHLFVMRPTGKGRPVDVMGDMDADTPSKPFGGPEEFTFTPDGKQLVFTARDAGPKEPWSTDFDLYREPIDGSTPPVCLTEKNPAWDCCPSFSPDGKTMAYLAMTRPGYESDRFRIILHRWSDGKRRVLTRRWDRSPSAICWSADGDALYATAANLGQRSLFRIDTATGNVRIVVRDGYVGSPVVSGTRIVYSLNHLKSPAELYSVRPDGTGRRPLTRINAKRIAAARMGDCEQFSFKGYNDETVYAYVVKPAGFDPARMYPVAFLIHGGPQGSFGNTFHYRWNPQAYAGAGYAAVMVDFHGSVGYGQAFTDSIRGDWGGKPLVDLKKGLEAALQRYPWMDGDRVGALGASFGGYMVNWIAGNWPDRFRCLVNHDGNLDERMAYFDTDELWFPEWDHLGTPWDNPQGYEKHNPVNHVGSWKTPMLVIHGARDYRVVDVQGIATFNALQRLGIPSRLLYFPDENHWVLKPHNSILWHRTVISWLDRWLKPEHGRAPPRPGSASADSLRPEPETAFSSTRM